MADNLKQNYNGSMLFGLTVSEWLVILAGLGLRERWVMSDGARVEQSNVMGYINMQQPVSNISWDLENYYEQMLFLKYKLYIIHSQPIDSWSSLGLNEDIWVMLPEVFVVVECDGYQPVNICHRS